MIRGLSKSGLGSITDEQLIEKAAEYGFGVVDMDAKALVDKHGEQGAAKLLSDHQVTLGSIGLNVEWRGTDEQFREGLKQLPLHAAAAAQLGCTACCTYILPSTDYKSALFTALAVSRLRLIADVLDAYGIRFALEFVGPHHLRTAWANPFIWTVEETLALISAINRPNVGLLVDAYHCHTTGFTPEHLRGLRADQVVHVHINDARDLPVDELLDNDRLYPGEGIIDLKGFLAALADIGYKGPVVQEILTRTAPEETPDELLSRSKAGFDKVFA
ncbi:sugar phosphate isomerase/epimerase family protein [Paenibacillus sp. FSL H8-0537]|uniref:sugar phosphate isomerase/epimerase family protein n=1 Tax=Paenibacillus sp. FSL H8-0537 TaxID=2921399 RepID=UPI00310119A3